MTRVSSKPNLLQPEVGDLIDGYRIVRPHIAAGGSGIVHEAVDAQGRRCALKVLQREKIIQSLKEKKQKDGSTTQAAEKFAQERYNSYAFLFKAEFQKLIGLLHPHVAQAYAFGFYEGYFYLSSEFIDGFPLATYLRHAKPKEMIPLFVQTLEALDFLHKSGLIHLDIKSENVLVQEIDGEVHVKIIDLGLAMNPDDYAGQFCGTIHYMAPEVALGRKAEVDELADLFSFAVLMYFCLTRSWPFPRTDQKERDIVRKLIQQEALPPMPSEMFIGADEQDYPKHLDDILMHLLQKKPEDRFFPTARAVMNALLSKSPDAFQETPTGSYLIPEGNQHIGREKEREMLKNCAFHILEGKHQALIFIEGEAGFGKSHLIHKLKQYIAQDAELLFMHHVHFPANPVLCEQWKEQILASMTAATKPVVILLDDLHVLYEEDKAKKDVQSYAAIRQFLEGLFRLAAERKLHPQLYQQVKPLLVVASYQPRFLNIEQLCENLHLATGSCKKVQLEPLSYLELVEYLKKTPAFKNRELPLERVKELHRQTNGIPAEIKEQLELIDSQGVLFDLEGRILLRLPKKAEKPITPRTEVRLFEQYEQCDAEETQILKLMAVWNWKYLAPAIKYQELTHFLPQFPLKQKLNELVRRDILFLDAEHKTYTFKNEDFLPKLIYRSMPQKERYRWHLQILNLLQRGKKQQDLILLHQAFLPVGHQSYRALIQLIRKKLFQSGDAILGMELAEYACSLSEAQPKLHAYFSNLLVVAYQETGFFKQAQERAKKILQELPDSLACYGTKARALLHLANIALQAYDFASALKYVQTVKAGFHSHLLYKSPNILLLNLLNTEARYYYDLAKVDAEKSHAAFLKASELFEQSRRLEKKLPPLLQQQVHNNLLGDTCLMLGDYKKAIQYLKEEAAKYRKGSYLFGQTAAHLSLANAYRLLQKYDDALVHAKQALALARKPAQGKWLRLAYNMLATIYHSMDRFDLALKANDQYFSAAALQEDEAAYQRSAIACWGSKGHCYKELRQFDRALLHFHAIIEAKPQAAYLMSAYEGLGETYFLQQDFEKSDEYLMRAAKILQQLPVAAAEAYHFPIHLMRAQILYQRGRVDEAKRILLELKPMAKKQKQWTQAWSKVERNFQDYSWLKSSKH